MTRYQKHELLRRIYDKAKGSHRKIVFRWADLKDQTTRNLIAEAKARRKAEREQAQL